MANSLQDQLLKAGLTNKKKANQADRERNRQTHLERTGKSPDQTQARAQAEADKQARIERDRALNRDKEAVAQAKALAAQVRQLIDANAITSSKPEMKYQFVAGKKVKVLYVDAPVAERLAKGRLAIVAKQFGVPADACEDFAVVALPVAEKLRERVPEHFIHIVAAQTAPDADDPYAAYQIPDDLMW